MLKSVSLFLVPGEFVNSTKALTELSGRNQHGDIYFVYRVVVCCSHDSVLEYRQIVAARTFLR